MPHFSESRAGIPLLVQNRRKEIRVFDEVASLMVVRAIAGIKYPVLVSVDLSPIIIFRRMCSASFDKTL